MRLWHASFALIAALTLFAAAGHAETFQWTQYGANGLEARALTDQSTCPIARIDGQQLPMQVRAAPGADYPVTICAIAVPKAAKSIAIGDTALAAGVATPKRIVVLGDTGCRLKGIYLQDCNDPVKWPFKQVADAIAAKKPDLVIHVGDYHYRETPCLLGAGCAGSPYGDTWAVWREDFFAPTASLLASAPWVMVRGNHEECGRGGKGWSRAIDPGPFDAAKGCNGPDAPFAVPFGNLSLVSIDTALAPEPKLEPAQVETYRAQYAEISKLASGPTWVLQHRPIWSIGGTVAGLMFGDNKTLAAAARETLPSQVQMILSGHHHIFQVLGYEQDLPLQIVSGHGGDYLNQGSTADPAGWAINGVTVKAGLHKTAQFGFAMLEQRDKDWVVTNYDRDGKALEHCDLIGRAVTCSGE